MMLIYRWTEDMSFLTYFYTYASYNCEVAILFLQEISHWTEDTHMYHHLWNVILRLEFKHMKYKT